HVPVLGTIVPPDAYYIVKPHRGHHEMPQRYA
ncbi:MAG: hypothetical protein QOC74_3573, partial [Pseudonocardiales bacterium]|nr:hypothetical protein [Pseudonocardiales bacterium]